MHNLTWNEQIAFNDEMRKGECFVGIESLIQYFNDKSQIFEDKFCLFLEHGRKLDTKDEVEKPFAVAKCKYTGCGFILNF